MLRQVETTVNPVSPSVNPRKLIGQQSLLSECCQVIPEHENTDRVSIRERIVECVIHDSQEGDEASIVRSIYLTVHLGISRRYR